MKTILLLIPLWIVREEIIQTCEQPDIVFSQFLLETGHGTSYAFKQYNNCFGFTNRSGLMRFKTWQESVRQYKRYQQRYDCVSDYYQYLKRTWNAPNMDQYINKVKSIKYKL